MGYYAFVKRSDERVTAFTLLELIIIVAIIGILAGIAAPIYADFRYKAQVATAQAIIREIEAGINVYYYRNNDTYPATLSDAMIAVPLDPWGNPYQYLSSQDPNWPSSFRYDRNMMPLNSDFDLYSMGQDGLTNRGLQAPVSADDVVRAGNGAFVDLGALY
jgi:general secretion pathway protein G